MALQTPAMTPPAIPEAAAVESRRLLALPGIVAIVGALVSAGLSFTVLLGLTPITPDESTPVWLSAINGAFVIL